MYVSRVWFSAIFFVTLLHVCTDMMSSRPYYAYVWLFLFIVILCAPFPLSKSSIIIHSVAAPALGLALMLYSISTTNSPLNCILHPPVPLTAPAGVCTSDAQCAPTEVCEGGVCAFIGEVCRADSECLNTEACNENGRCQYQPSCDSCLDDCEHGECPQNNDGRRAAGVTGWF